MTVGDVTVRGHLGVQQRPAESIQHGLKSAGRTQEATNRGQQLGDSKLETIDR